MSETRVETEEKRSQTGREALIGINTRAMKKQRERRATECNV